MNQNDKTQVDPNWLSGFCKAAEECGLSNEQAALLLKESAHRNLLETNSKYAEGFKGEMDKRAGFLSKLLGYGLMGTGAVMGGNKLLNTGRQAMLDPLQSSYADRLQQMRNQALGGADPFSMDMAAGAMARGGRDRAKAQWDQYQGMFGDNGGGGNGKRDYYRRWYLE